MSTAFFCIDIVNKSDMSISQKFSALNIIKRTCENYAKVIKISKKKNIIVADELFLHRGFSFLIYSRCVKEDAEKYYNNLPIPDYAIICNCDKNKILDRISNRNSVPNCYAGKSSDEIYELLKKSEIICDVAKIY